MKLNRVKRRVHAPIFLNCFSRGGSNILWNVFLSHPEVCSPIRETLQIFSLQWRALTLAGVGAALRSGQPRLFDQWHLQERRPLNNSAADYIDRVLKERQALTFDDAEMRYKNESETYTAAEVDAARLCAKNNNGLVFLTPLLEELYPDATFFALVREPVALYESHKRRGLTRSPEEFVRFYNCIGERMAGDADRLERAFIVRFEDVLQSPVETAERLYAQADLDIGRLDKLRFKSKAHFRADGSRGAAWAEGSHRWLAFDEVNEFLVGGVNDVQAARLENQERDAVLAGTEALRKRLGYA